MGESPSKRDLPHGGGCECEQLAAALGCDPGTITFDFCYRVLQRHWKLNCRHGTASEPSHTSVAGRWREIGRPDAVQAILISNAPEDG